MYLYTYDIYFEQAHFKWDNIHVVDVLCKYEEICHPLHLQSIYTIMYAITYNPSHSIHIFIHMLCYIWVIYLCICILWVEMVLTVLARLVLVVSMYKYWNAVVLVTMGSGWPSTWQMHPCMCILYAVYPPYVFIYIPHSPMCSLLICAFTFHQLSIHCFLIARYHVHFMCRCSYAKFISVLFTL